MGLRLGTSPSPAPLNWVDTASQWTKAGFSFCPLILEAVGGGWSDALRSVVAWIASESKRSGPIDGSDEASP